jgi:hypothetical protein
MRRGCFFAVALVIIAACGGRTAELARAAFDCSEISTACESLASAICTRRTECATQAGSGQRFSSDAECRERWALACNIWTTTPDTAISTGAVTECAAEVSRAACGRVSSIAQSGWSNLPWCLRIPGSRAEGAACENDAQCVTSLCRFYQGALTCRSPLPEPAYEDEPCNPTMFCAGSLQCEGGRCRRSTCAPSGCFDYYASCGGIDEPTRRCSLGTECVNQSDRGAGQCAPYAAEGQACADYAGPRCLFPAQCVERVCTLTGGSVCTE